MEASLVIEAPTSENGFKCLLESDRFLNRVSNKFQKQFDSILLQVPFSQYSSDCEATSVTRLGDLLDFGQLFKAFDNHLFCPNLPHS